MSAGSCPLVDDAAAYVLGALPDGECEGYRDHLAGCAALRDKVAELTVVADVPARGRHAAGAAAPR